MAENIPDYQTAVQLVGPDQLQLNSNKPVDKPGSYQILAKVEAVGLCFSDLKLLKQFSSHARKGHIKAGIDPEVLAQVPSYVPDKKPAVPGHETVVSVCAVGDKVKSIEPGCRYLVQTDYRWLPTENSVAALGYNFEGALQEYVLLDQRVITNEQGETLLLPASEQVSASAVALVEPWACVEDAYACKERTTVKEQGRMLVVIDSGFEQAKFESFLKEFGRPAKITFVSDSLPDIKVNIPIEKFGEISLLADAEYDDVIYFGSQADVVEQLFAKVAAHGLLNIVLCGGKFGRKINTPVGRVHYGGIRFVGTTGSDPSESMRHIPDTGEIRPGDRINVIGAGGPMGVMHVVRSICQGVDGVSLYAGDIDPERLTILERIAAPLAEKRGISFKVYNPLQSDFDIAFDYTVIMVPNPKIVCDSIGQSCDNAVINIFAGISADILAEIDIDLYIEKKLYFIGTSGSVLEDMKTVLPKLENGQLDTNVSVAAICGLDSAIGGIRAVEQNLIPGKIIVYPACRNLPLTPLDKLSDTMPEVADALSDGLWTKKAEDILLRKLRQ
ncbi:MAG: alcohol dehydrogenase catalytic domain-containing protein [Planctomycetota bacterium]|jgi:threonine dehydrogenase-like Zn-dependent dehydrogenase